MAQAVIHAKTLSDAPALEGPESRDENDTNQEGRKAIFSRKKIIR
jgi:hypothetical protein